MHRVRTSLGLALLLLLVLPRAPLRANDDDKTDAEELSPADRPVGVPFNEASGRFRIEVEAEPANLRLDDTLTLTVRITATGSVHKPPGRLDLAELPAFAKRFYIEDDSEDGRNPLETVTLLGMLVAPRGAGPALALGALAPRTVWEFHYHLKPKSVAVNEVPSIPFVFDNRNLQLAPKLRYEVAYTEPIALEVKEREVIPVRVRAPESVFHLSAGPELFARRTVWGRPGPAMSVALLVLPPACCVAWYLCWQRLYPDAARQSRRRRSRAAQRALDALRRAPRSGIERATMAHGAVTHYLQQRLDLPIAEPTPRETAGHLQRLHLSPELTAETVRFFRSCDAARFLPDPPEDTDLAAAAAEVVLAVEAETWPREHS
jgi:hypothetical protein